MERQTFLITGGILLVLASLGVADAFLTERETIPGISSNISSQRSSASSLSSGTQSSVGVKKLEEVDVRETATRMGFTIQQTQEQSLITGIMQNKEQVNSIVLLKDGDRSAFVSWVETPLVKNYFVALKESLHSLFSPQVEDLIDEIQRPKGKPPRNFLTFRDPGISEERLIFIRIRDRLFELHLAEGREDAVYQYIEALTN